MNKTAIVFALVMTMTCAARTAAQAGAQGAASDIKALRGEVETLKQGQTAMRKELAEIKALLLSAARPAAPPAPPASPVGMTLKLDDLPTKGDARARLTLIEFSDFQCPFCARYVRDTLPAIEREYVQTGKLRYAFSDLPLESIHPQAFKAAQAAQCAADQGKYWQMHDQLFANPRALSAPELSQHAQAVGLSVAGFQQCLFSDKHAGRVRGRMAEAERLGVAGTPSFLLAVTTPEAGEWKVVRVLSGAQPFSAFKAALDHALNP